MPGLLRLFLSRPFFFNNSTVSLIISGLPQIINCESLSIATLDSSSNCFDLIPSGILTFRHPSIDSLVTVLMYLNFPGLFLSNSEKLNVKIVNKNVVLFKAIDQERKYSESAIIDRKSGELIHEITRNIKSENSEKDISFYLCRKKEKKV